MGVEVTIDYKPGGPGQTLDRSHMEGVAEEDEGGLGLGSWGRGPRSWIAVVSKELGLWGCGSGGEGGWSGVDFRIPWRRV